MMGSSQTNSSFDGKRVVVMGLGRFGGGIGVTRWLVQQGASVTVTDLANASALKDSLSKIDDISVKRCLGRHDIDLLDDCDLLVKSPAVDRRTSPFFAAAIRRGIEWSSEMNLFLERCPATIVGITGSAGKSTTTGMTADTLQAAASQPGWRHGRVWVGGNIGASLLHELDEMRAEDVVVLELSSFQLEDATRLQFQPAIGLITNLRENHLDRHGDLQSYAAAKAQLFCNMTSDDVLWLSRDLDLSLFSQLETCLALRGDFGMASGSSLLIDAPTVGQRTIDVALQIPGRHNLMNAAGAAAIAVQLGVDNAIIATALNRFAGLPHRLALVGEFDGVRYFNDSKATSPAAAMTSIAAFERKPIVIVGGSDKGGSLVEFGRFLASHAKSVLCTGATGAALAQCVDAAQTSAEKTSVLLTRTLEAAVKEATARAYAGDVVLLAPGCPSYDAFQNYEQRGDAFVAAVRAQCGATVH